MALLTSGAKSHNTAHPIYFCPILALPAIITSGSKITCDPLITTQRDNNQRWQRQDGNPLLSHSSTDVLLSSLLLFEAWQDDICPIVLWDHGQGLQRRTLHMKERPTSAQSFENLEYMKSTAAAPSQYIL